MIHHLKDNIVLLVKGCLVIDNIITVKSYCILVAVIDWKIFLFPAVCFLMSSADDHSWQIVFVHFRATIFPSGSFVSRNARSAQYSSVTFAFWRHIKPSEKDGPLVSGINISKNFVLAN